jgi:ACT domain-containing protein
MKDVNLLLASLPDDLQEACDFIMNGKSISETVKSMGVSRATFYYQRIIPLKKIFREQFLT